MRTGNNPLRNRKASRSNPTSVACVIVHLPGKSGYHEKRFEVVKLCLESMRAGCQAPILVWDNGSNAEMRDWLMDEYRPDYLVLSPNVGKQSARASIIHMFPPRTIIGISDDDMLFYPGWFEACVKLLKHFPNVGVVSGYPVRTQFRWGCTNTIRWAQKNAILEVGRFIPDEWDKDFCTSIGRDYLTHVDTCNIMKDMDYRITFEGQQAYATGHHCQFIAYNDKIARFCVWNDEAMGEEKTFDTGIDNAGLLRLTTVNRYCRHIGNVLDNDILRDAKKFGFIKEVA